MGWFAIACVCGFLGYRVWCSPSKTKPTVLYVVLVGGVLWIIIWSGHFLSTLWTDGLSDAVDDVAGVLNDGLFARFLLGLVLGAGTAFAFARSSFNALDAGGATGSEASPLPILSLGLGVLTVAITAPYIDRWLPHVNGIKSPLIELQLAGSTTHRVSVAEGSAEFFDTKSLDYLKTYDERIKSDIEYYRSYGGLDDLQLKQSRELQKTFKAVVAPVAGCIQTGIDEGWLSVRAARQLLAPAVNRLELIIFGEAKLREIGILDEEHNRFWQEVESLPEKVRRWPELESTPEKARLKQINISDCEVKNLPAPGTLPRFENYRNLPYLHAAAALLISFMGDGDKALLVLQMASERQDQERRPALAFKDFTFLFALGRLAYYEERTDDVSPYFQPLDELWNLAQDRIDQIENDNKKDDSKKCGGELSPLCYAQIYKIVAENLMAYYLAEDLARGNLYAEQYRAHIRECARNIKGAIDALDAGQLSAGQLSQYINGERYGILDTYAYATLVLESEKPVPNYGFIRTDAFQVLRSVVEHLRDEVKDDQKKSVLQTKLPQSKLARLVSELKVSEAHFESAREAIGE